MKIVWKRKSSTDSHDDGRDVFQAAPMAARPTVVRVVDVLDRLETPKGTELLDGAVEGHSDEIFAATAARVCSDLGLTHSDEAINWAIRQQLADGVSLAPVIQKQDIATVSPTATATAKQRQEAALARFGWPRPDTAEGISPGWNTWAWRQLYAPWMMKLHPLNNPKTDVLAGFSEIITGALAGSGLCFLLGLPALWVGLVAPISMTCLLTLNLVMTDRAVFGRVIHAARKLWPQPRVKPVNEHLMEKWEAIKECRDYIDACMRSPCGWLLPGDVERLNTMVAARVEEERQAAWADFGRRLARARVRDLLAMQWNAQTNPHGGRRRHVTQEQITSYMSNHMSNYLPNVNNSMQGY